MQEGGIAMPEDVSKLLREVRESQIRMEQDIKHNNEIQMIKYRELENKINMELGVLKTKVNEISEEVEELKKEREDNQKHFKRKILDRLIDLLISAGTFGAVVGAIMSLNK